MLSCTSWPYHHRFGWCRSKAIGITKAQRRGSTSNQHRRRSSQRDAGSAAEVGEQAWSVSLWEDQPKLQLRRCETRAIRESHASFCKGHWRKCLSGDDLILTFKDSVPTEQGITARSCQQTSRIVWCSAGGYRKNLEKGIAWKQEVGCCYRGE